MAHEEGENLIFLLGQPRGGTTLLQTLLAQHPEIFTYSETWFLLPLLFMLKEGGMASPAYSTRFCTVALKELLEKTENKKQTYFLSVRKMAQTLYGSCLKNSGKKYFLDKSPVYFLVMKEIASIFPAARFIILLRNPMAVLSSVGRTFLGGNLAAIPSSPPILHYTFVAPGLIAEGKNALGERAISLKYEDLVASPETEIRRICDYVGISYEPKMLSYSHRVEGSLGDKNIENYSRPVDLAQNWISTLGDSVNHRFAMAYLEYLGPELFKNLGYDYNQTRELILETHKNQKAGVWQRMKYFSRAMKNSLSRSTLAARLAFQIEFDLTFRRFYPTFPPVLPDYTLLDGLSAQWERSVIERMRPSKPIPLFWKELEESSSIESE